MANRHDVQIINYPKPDPPKEKPKADPVGEVISTAIIVIVVGIPIAFMVCDFWACFFDRYRCW